MCNVTYRRKETAELNYKVMDVTTQITVNISDINNCTDPDTESHNRNFSHLPVCHLSQPFPAGIYRFEVNNRNTKTWCEICLKLTIKIPE